MKLPFATPYSLQTSLSVNKVSELLRSSIGPIRIFFPSLATSPVIGRVGEDWAVLHARPSFFVRNSFRRVLDIKFRENDQGTLLTGSFRLPWLVSIFMAFWIGFLALATAINLFHEVSRLGIQVIWSDPTLIIPSGMLLFGLLIVLVGVWISKASEANVTDFLEELLVRRPAVANNEDAIRSGEIVIRPRHQEPTNL